MESLWKRIERKGLYDRSDDSDNSSTDSSDSTGSPPLKRPRLCRRLLREFQTAQDLQELKSVPTDVIELKDYAEWLNSQSQYNVDDILDPIIYAKWFSTLDFQAKVNAFLHPYDFFKWCKYMVERGGPPCGVFEPEITRPKDRKYGHIALEHFNSKSNQEVYEYVCHWNALYFEDFVHLNFYARVKTSKSRLERPSEQLFFAEVCLENQLVTECCILKSREFIGDSCIRHPPHLPECRECIEESQDIGYSGCACDDE